MSSGGSAESLSGAWLVVGGAGFIGSHFVGRLLASPAVEAVRIYDNFSSGREWHYRQHAGDPRLRVERGDVEDLYRLQTAMRGCEAVIHLASNPDIAAAARDPDLDFRAGTALTRNVLEAMRLSGARRLLYASGSGVYGDLGAHEAAEDHGPLLPVSTYGASKLAGEALIAAYCAMCDLRARAFRFGNVIGPRQTHGVGYDFVRRLRQDPARLAILGDGRQSKSYIYVDDVVDAVLTAHAHEGPAFDVYNVATGDYVTVAEIAQLAVDALGLRGVRFDFSGGDRGWRGDVPVVRLSTAKIRALGWENRMDTRAAMRAALAALIGELPEPGAER